MEFTFLAAEPQHLPLIAHWYVREWGHLSGMTDEQEMEKLHKYLHTDRIPLIILAKAEGKIVGAAQLKYYEMDIYPDREHWLGGVYVDAPYRGRGIGRQLVEQALAVAKKLSVPRLYLQTEDHSGGLYGRLGWQPLEQVCYKGVDVLVMERPV